MQHRLKRSMLRRILEARSVFVGSSRFCYNKSFNSLVSSASSKVQLPQSPQLVSRAHRSIQHQMTSFARSAVEEAKANVTMSVGYEKASRALSDMGVEVTDDSVRLYLALVSLTGQSGGYVTKKLFKHHCVKVEGKDSAVKKFWMVKKEDLPVLPFS